MSQIEISNLVKKHGNQTILSSLKLSIKSGEFVVLVGPSGCGKSTTLRLLAGLEEITSGTIAIDGRVINNTPPRDRNIAMVFQNYALYPHMTVRENMAFSLRMRNATDQDIADRVQRASTLLGLDEFLDRRPQQLSGGQRQRVAMGRAIVRDPSVFLFDEPLSNLDAKLRNQMRAEIKKLHERLKTTIIYVTHDQVEAMTLADRIVLLRAGIIEQVGTPTELYHNPINMFVGGFLGNPSMNFLEAEIRNDDLYCAEEKLGAKSDFPELKNFNGSKVVLGLRPEKLLHKGAGSKALQGQLDLVEILGSATLLHIRLGSKQKMAGFSQSHQFDTNQIISLHFNPEDCLFFDPADEKRIGALT